MYESPIDLLMSNIQTQIVEQQEEAIYKAVFDIGVNVTKDELLRALAYDRQQYEIGFADAMDSLVRCKDCKHWKDIPGATDSAKYCEIGFYKIEESGYCSWAERKDNEK
jgi:hypothetical protein